MGESQISAKRAKAREREARALELRKRGWTVDEIARELGVSHPAVSRILRRAMARLDEEIRENAREYIALQIARLEALYSRLQDRVDNGSLPAIRTAAEIVRDIAELLGAGREAPAGPTIVQFVRLVSYEPSEPPKIIEAQPTGDPDPPDREAG